MTTPTFAESVENLFAAGLDLPAGPVFDRVRDKMQIAAEEAITYWYNRDGAAAFTCRGKLRGLLEAAKLFGESTKTSWTATNRHFISGLHQWVGSGWATISSQTDNTEDEDKD